MNKLNVTAPHVTPFLQTFMCYPSSLRICPMSMDIEYTYTGEDDSRHMYHIMAREAYNIMESSMEGIVFNPMEHYHNHAEKTRGNLLYYT